jgi:hypothetical protein
MSPDRVRPQTRTTEDARMNAFRLACALCALALAALPSSVSAASLSGPNGKAVNINGHDRSCVWTFVAGSTISIPLSSGRTLTVIGLCGICPGGNGGQDSANVELPCPEYPEISTSPSPFDPPGPPRRHRPVTVIHPEIPPPPPPPPAELNLPLPHGGHYREVDLADGASHPCSSCTDARLHGHKQGGDFIGSAL